MVRAIQKGDNVMINEGKSNSQKSILPIFFMVLSTIAGQLIYLRFFSLYHIVIISLFIMICIKTGVIFIGKKFSIMFFLAIWIFEAMISIIWAPDKWLALQYFYYVFLIAAMSIIFNNYIKKNNIENFAVFMVWILFLCNIIAMWETVTGNHLIPNYLSSPVRLRLLKYVPGTFFRNPNDFATFIIMIIPFSLAMSQRKKIRIIAIFNIIGAFFSIFASQSRTQIIMLCIMYICFGLFFHKKRFFTFAAFFFAAIAVFYTIYPDFKNLIDIGLKSISTEEIISSTQGGSLGVRIALLKNGLHILIDTFGFGIGAGCHRAVMAEYASRYFSTGNIVVMHNLVGEIFVDYGLIIGILFIVTIIWSIKKLILIYKINDNIIIRQLAIYFVILLVLFPICGISSSSILQLTSLWISLCFISVFIEIYEFDNLKQ